MGMLSDDEIRELGCKLISPFTPDLVREVDGQGIISFGTSSYGYDLSLSPEWKTPVTDRSGEVILLDPKNAQPEQWDSTYANAFDMAPHSFVLNKCLEYVRVPRNCLGLVLTKSTYARNGIISLCTPLEPEWEGEVTLEFANLTNCRVRMHAGEGAVQVVFLKSDRLCGKSYADRNGKYQHQRGVVLSRV